MDRIETLQCDCCSYFTECKPYPGEWEHEGKDVWLCELCAHTATGTFSMQPSEYKELNVLKTICYIGNRLLEEMRKEK